MNNRTELIGELVRLVKGVQLLQVPIIYLEQNPAKMGPTIDELDQLLTNQSPITKMSFSCCGSDKYMQALQASGRKQVILAGIETHVCVYQSATDLAAAGYCVEVVANATSSRSLTNKEIALAKIGSLANTSITTTEMLLFELMRSADNPAFRDMLRIVK